MKKSLIFLSVLLVVAGVGTTSASAFYYDFETGIPTEWSNISNPESVQGYAGLASGTNAFSGNFLRNETGGYALTAPFASIAQTPTTLTLTELPTHNSISLGFLLAIIDSWDGSSTKLIAGYPVGPDNFNVRVDGNTIFSKTFSNDPNKTQTYQGAKLGSGLSARGFNSDWLDSAYNLGLNIPHTGATLKVEWFASGAGWQGINALFGNTHDESWAIDNVRVDLLLNGDPVPLPPTALLLGSGLLGLGILGFRKKQKA